METITMATIDRLRPGDVRVKQLFFYRIIMVVDFSF